MPSAHADASRKGKAVEHFVAASCILASGATLNASMSLVDDEGVDTVFHRRGKSGTVAVQVKSRFFGSSALDQGTFLQDVRDVAFKPRNDLYMLFVAVDGHEPDIGPLWLVPSYDFAEKTSVNPRGRRRFAASTSDASSDQWSHYRCDKAELPARLLAILGEI